MLSLVQTAVGGKACTQITEGEKQFDLTLRFPQRLRGDLEAIKKLPVELLNNTVTPGYMGSLAQTAVSRLILELGQTPPPGRLQEALALSGRVHAMLTEGPNGEAPPAELGKLAVLAGVSEFPMRVKCASLAWHTVNAALKGEAQPASTE